MIYDPDKAADTAVSLEGKALLEIPNQSSQMCCPSDVLNCNYIWLDMTEGCNLTYVEKQTWSIALERKSKGNMEGMWAVKDKDGKASCWQTTPIPMCKTIQNPEKWMEIAC